MRDDDRIRLRHMIEAAQEATRFAEHRQRKDLDEDRMLTLALMKAIEIIGEAASKLSSELRETYPEIPWPAILGVRNKLVHAYFQIDLDVVWRTTVNELPGLIQSLTDIIESDK
ncbi:MAG: HepT-like ribonuclease domain-containing protein [Thermodesulfobacteriota bacterium]